jgi:hypothetical protein
MKFEWKAETFGPETGSALSAKLNEIESLGWSVWLVLVNGVDRWTIISRREVD